MKRQLNFAACLLLAALPLAASAAETVPPPASRSEPAAPSAPAPKEQPAPLFDALDTNHDGYLTKAEAKRSAEVTARFGELDSDHDGRIDAREFIRGMQPKL